MIPDPEDEGTPVPVGDRLLPASLRLVAEASGSDAGKQLECSLDITIRLTGTVDRSTYRVVQHGTGGGEARRGWTVPGHNGIGFWADLFIPDLELHLIGGDSVEVQSPASQRDASSRFWHELGRLPGNTRHADPEGEVAHGSWTCRPMDTSPSSGEYYDVSGSVAGSWTLRVIP